MRPTYLGFEVQKRTLQLAQKNIDIVGNNISNINTPGYTRQRVDLYSEYVSVNSSFRWASPNSNLSMQGQGVNAYGVSQIRDIYIDRRYRENVAVEAESEKCVGILSDIEDVLDNFETDGLQYFTQEFFNSLQDYSMQTPDSSEVATICVNTAKNLCRLLNDYDKQLREVESMYVGELKDTVSHINNITDQVNKLNERIRREKIHYNEEYGPNELYDELNMFVDELATYGDVEVTENSDGTFSLKMGGIELVNGEKLKTNRILMKDYDTYQQAILTYESGEELNLASGQLKGYYDMINGNGVYATGHQNGSYGIAYFKSAIDQFARTLAGVFNSANGGDDDQSRRMFTSIPADTVITAGNIHISDEWEKNPTMIGQVRRLDPESGQYQYGYDEKRDEVTGEVNLQNTNVIYLISQLENSSIEFGNSHDFQGGFYEYISFISNRLGQTIQYESSRYDTAEVTVDGLLDARDNVSAPQMDEEGINMMNYQKWYSASSRLVTTLDELLDKLINGTGRVGL